MAVQHFIAEHGYLVSVTLGLPGVALFIWLAGANRQSVIAAGAIETFHATPLIWFNEVYWSPHRLGGWVLGVEDFLVCFSLGAGVWFAAIFPMRHRVTFSLRPWPVLARLVLVAVPSTGLAVAVWTLGAGVMETLLIVMIATGLVLACLFPRRLKMSAAAALAYPPYYVAVLLSASLLSDGFTGIWRGPQLWGPRLLGLPLEEYSFVIVYSAVYPLIIGFAFNARWGAALPVATAAQCRS